VPWVLPDRSFLAEPSGEMSRKALNKAKKAARKAMAETSQDYDDANAQKGESRHRFIRFRVYDITIRLVVRAKQNEDKGLEAPPPKDDDPEGLKLVAADDPLERASKVLGLLGEFGKDDIDVNAISFDVAIRQSTFFVSVSLQRGDLALFVEKYLKAARALHRAHARDPHHPEVHVRIVQLARKGGSSLRSRHDYQRDYPVESDVPERVKSVLEESVAALKPAEISLDAFNSQYLQRHSSSAPAILASAKVSQVLGAPREEVEALLFTTLTDGVQLGLGVGFALPPRARLLTRSQDAGEIVSYLSQIESARTDEFRIACDGRFTLSKVFKSGEEQAALRRQCIDPRDENEVETVF